MIISKKGGFHRASVFSFTKCRFGARRGEEIEISARREDFNIEPDAPFFSVRNKAEILELLNFFQSLLK